MKLKSGGERSLTKRERRWVKFLGSMRGRLDCMVEVEDEGHILKFHCDNEIEAERALSLWIKEQGTMRWLSDELRPGEVFLDIGANIGIYTLAAARRVGGGGKVYAFEPHKANALALMRNGALNGFQERIDVFSVALSDRVKVGRFDYRSLRQGESNNQLESEDRRGLATGPAAPTFHEQVVTASIDDLLDLQAIKPADLVKIDVDGIEYDILRGMARWLRRDDRPRSMQIEINLDQDEAIAEFLKSVGYRLESRHATLAGKKLIEKGARIEQIAHNAIYRPI